jgi:hypothetical protein
MHPQSQVLHDGLSEHVVFLINLTRQLAYSSRLCLFIQCWAMAHKLDVGRTNHGNLTSFIIIGIDSTRLSFFLGRIYRGLAPTRSSTNSVALALLRIPIFLVFSYLSSMTCYQITYVLLNIGFATNLLTDLLLVVSQISGCLLRASRFVRPSWQSGVAVFLSGFFPPDFFHCIFEFLCLPVLHFESNSKSPG